MTQCHWIYRYKLAYIPRLWLANIVPAVTMLWFEAVLEKIAH